MTLKEIKNALEEVQNMCQAKPYCNKCLFRNAKAVTFNDCFLAPIPEQWELDKVDFKERGKQ